MSWQALGFVTFATSSQAKDAKAVNAFSFQGREGFRFVVDIIGSNIPDDLKKTPIWIF